MSEEKGKSRIVLIIALAVLLLGSIGGNVYLFTTKNKEIEEKEAKIKIITEKESELKKAQDEINKLVSDLQAAKDSLAAKGIENEELNQQLASAQALARQAAATKGRDTKKIAALNANLAEMQEAFKKLLAENEELKKTVAKQGEEITTKNQIIVTKNDTIKNLLDNKKSLESTVKKGKKLVAKDFKIGILIAKTMTTKFKFDKANGGYVFKTKDLALGARIEFTIAANDIADIEQKTVYMQIVDPANTVIYDLQKGGGEFTGDDKTQFYTMKKDITYNKSAQTLQFDYIRGARYTVGTHKINAYIDGKLVGSGSFIIK